MIANKYAYESVDSSSDYVNNLTDIGIKNVTQRELMRLFEGDIKTDIFNSRYCSIVWNILMSKHFSYHISIKCYR